MPNEKPLKQIYDICYSVDKTPECIGIYATIKNRYETFKATLTAEQQAAFLELETLRIELEEAHLVAVYMAAASRKR